MRIPSVVIDCGLASKPYENGLTAVMMQRNSPTNGCRKANVAELYDASEPTDADRPWRNRGFTADIVAV